MLHNFISEHQKLDTNVRKESKEVKHGERSELGWDSPVVSGGGGMGGDLTPPCML